MGGNLRGKIMAETYVVYTFRYWEGRQGWQCTHVKYVALHKFLEQTGYVSDGKELFDYGCSWDVTERTMEDMARDISTGKIMFMPFSRNVHHMDMMFYLKAGFELRFMKARQFSDWKKDYCKYM